MKLLVFVWAILFMVPLNLTLSNLFGTLFLSTPLQFILYIFIIKLDVSLFFFNFKTKENAPYSSLKRSFHHDIGGFYQLLLENYSKTPNMRG